MLIYKYGEILIPENKIGKYLNKLKIKKEDLEFVKDTNKVDVFRYPYEERVNATTTLCAYTEEQMKWLKIHTKYGD